MSRSSSTFNRIYWGHLQERPEQDDNPNGADLHQLLLGLLPSQLLSHAGPPLPGGHQVAGLQAGLGGDHSVLPVGVSGGCPGNDLLIDC